MKKSETKLLDFKVDDKILGTGIFQMSENKTGGTEAKMELGNDPFHRMATSTNSSFSNHGLNRQNSYSFIPMNSSKENPMEDVDFF